MRAHKLLDNQPTTSFARFSNQATIDPMIPGRAAPAFAANFPSRELSAFNLFFIHSLAPPYLSPLLVPPDVGVDALGPPNRASIRTPIAIPTAVNMDTIVIPCSLTLRAPRGGGVENDPPLGFSSVVFARGMILKRNFG